MPLTVPAHGTVAYAFQRSDRRLHVTATSADGATYGTHGSIQIDSALGGRQTVTLSDHRTQRINLGPVPAAVDVSSWHLHIDAIAPSGPTTYDLDLSQLEDWRDIPEIASAVGSAVYTTTVNEVSFDTTLNNENAQLAAGGNPAYGTGPTPLTPAPSGLLGPVTLTPIAVAHIN
jgi:hypothetical protein